MALNKIKMDNRSSIVEGEVRRHEHEDLSPLYTTASGQDLRSLEIFLSPDDPRIECCNVCRALSIGSTSHTLLMGTIPSLERHY